MQEAGSQDPLLQWDQKGDQPLPPEHGQESQSWDRGSSPLAVALEEPPWKPHGPIDCHPPVAAFLALLHGSKYVPGLNWWSQKRRDIEQSQDPASYRGLRHKDDNGRTT